MGIVAEVGAIRMCRTVLKVRQRTVPVSVDGQECQTWIRGRSTLIPPRGGRVIYREGQKSEMSQFGLIRSVLFISFHQWRNSPDSY